MHAEQQARALVDGRAVILDAGAVGGSDFANGGAGAGHDLGDAEAVADFDQLAARDDRFSAGGQLVEGQKDGGRVVVDGDPRRAEQPLQKLRAVDVALSAPAGGEVVLQVGITGERRHGAERRAPQVGVQHHARGVDHAAQRRGFERRERPLDARLRRRPGSPAGGDFGPHGIERAPDFRDDKRAREAGDGPRKAVENLMDRGQLAKLLGSRHEFDGTRGSPGAQQTARWRRPRLVGGDRVRGRRVFPPETPLQITLDRTEVLAHTTLGKRVSPLPGRRRQRRYMWRG